MTKKMTVMTGTTHNATGASVRASDADREGAAEILRGGFSEGRLTRAELDDRVAAVYGATTVADLRGLTADLPPARRVPVAAGPTCAAPLPVLDRLPGPGPGADQCLLMFLLFAFPSAGIIYWILSARARAG